MTSPLFACLCALLVLSRAKSGWAVALGGLDLAPQSPQVQACDRSVDVAIIGAGPSGTYSAYKLRHRGLNVELFEYSDRIGGRLYTAKLPNVPDLNLELGAMRYIKGAMKKVENLVLELGLTPKNFTQGFGRPGTERFYLRGQSLTYYDIKNGTIPYNLSPEEKANQDHIVSYYLEKLTGYNTTGSYLRREDVMKLRLKNGTELYKLTFDEALNLVATEEGKAFVTDRNIFQFDVVPGTSAVNIFDEDLGEYSLDAPVLTPAEGMSAIAQTLAERFEQASPKHKVTMNRQLKSISNGSSSPHVLFFDETRSDNGYTLSLRHAESVCANTVILAIPQYALSQLDWEPLKHGRVKEALNAVTPMPASKVFMTFTWPWWHLNYTSLVENPAFVMKSQFAFSQMYDWSRSNVSGNYAMMASYADVNHTKHLQMLNQGDDLVRGSAPGFNNVTTQLKDEILNDLKVALGAYVCIFYDCEPLSAISQWWNSYPFGGGYTAWNPGYNFNDVRNTIRRPSLTQDIFIVGSDHAFGATTPWTEGALDTVDEVFEAYF